MLRHLVKSTIRGFKILSKAPIQFGAVGILAMAPINTNLNPHQKPLAPNDMMPYYEPSHTSQRTNWNDFCYKMLAKGEVERIIIRPGSNDVIIILHRNAIIDGKPILYNIFYLKVPKTDIFERKLREFEQKLGIPPGDMIPVIYEKVDWLSSSPMLLLALPFLWIFMYNIYSKKGAKNMSFGSMLSGMRKAKFTLVDPLTRQDGTPKILFKDVAGLKEAKVEIMEFVDYLKDSQRFLKLGARLPKGVLLTGPPGCGKTLLAKAVASEANVPFMALAGSDFVEMIGGLGAARVRSLFKSAKKLSPCIIYIDEIDSIGKKRGVSTLYNGEMEQTLNQLLVEMDGLVTKTGIILLASTNRAEVLDQALTRAGRFDRQVYIDLPNLEERKEIFIKHSSIIRLDKAPCEYALAIAQSTPGMSGADIANVCNEAALHAARKDKRCVNLQDLEYAIERVVGGTEKRSSSISAEEKRMIAYHESGHALVGWLLEHTEPLIKVSIVPRTIGILGFARYLPSDQKLYNKEQFFDRMCMALGGRVGELVKFNHLSTGAQNDLQKVTDIAMSQVKYYGFDQVIGHISFPEEDPSDISSKPYSKQLANVIDHRSSVLVSKAFQTTLDLVLKNKDKLDILAEALLSKEVINAKEVEALIGPRPFKQGEAK